MLHAILSLFKFRLELSLLPELILGGADDTFSATTDRHSGGECSPWRLGCLYRWNDCDYPLSHGIYGWEKTSLKWGIYSQSKPRFRL